MVLGNDRSRYISSRTFTKNAKVDLTPDNGDGDGDEEEWEETEDRERRKKSAEYAKQRWAKKNGDFIIYFSNPAVINCFEGQWNSVRLQLAKGDHTHEKKRKWSVDYYATK